jgi:hypothetical protein
MFQRAFMAGSHYLSHEFFLSPGIIYPILEYLPGKPGRIALTDCRIQQGESV